MTFFLWSLSGAAAVVYWAMSLRAGESISRSCIKGLALVPLVVFALMSGASAVAVALALCSFGDVCLSRRGEPAFLAGLSAFALGHLAWIAVFVLRFDVDFASLSNVPKAVVLGGMVLLAVVMARILLPRAGALRVPVACYICVILGMGLVALTTPSWAVIAGAMLFMSSDMLLGLQTFALPEGARDERLANALIWPLYWAAIVVLTLACLP